MKVEVRVSHEQQRERTLYCLVRQIGGLVKAPSVLM